MLSREDLEQKLSASAYLTRCLNESSDEFVSLVCEDSSAACQQLIDRLQTGSNDAWLPAQVATLLQQAKAEFSLALAAADILQGEDGVAIGRLQSSFADACIDVALRSAWCDPAIRKLCRDLPVEGEPVPGLFVLGLGKLGGCDLNFSSDIDLIGFFDSDKVPTGPMQGKGDVCARVLKSLTRILSGNGLHELVWRVDWRLRPESSATQIAMSTDAALDYYFFRSLPWHRLALMKARVVAGDLQTGNEFLHDLEPYIWRQNLDFRALEELAYLKDRIDLEHPQLVKRGVRDTRIDTPAAGFNLKLGTGGIREIEFFANGLQLIWGGKVHELRTGHTVSALQQLAEQKIIEPDCIAQLVEDYLWLRRLENRVQMLENMQTHLLPEAQTDQKNLMQLCSLEDWNQLEAPLASIRQRVHARFDQVFRPDSPDTEKQPDVDLDLERLAPRTQEIVQGWSEGFRSYGVSEAQSLKMGSLYRALMQELLESGAEMGSAIAQLHAFFCRLPPGGQYLRLLQNSPRLLHGLVTPLIYSPPMQSLLEQTPHIIDSLMQSENTARTADDWPFDCEWVMQSPDYEVRLERMRRQVNEELYQLYLRFLDGELEPVRFQELLSDLAKYSLKQGLQVVSEKLDMPPGFAVLGMGKLGMSRMAPMSDLDITYICQNDASIDQATRFVNRLQTALSTRMKEGVVYEMDTRLRPSGRSGAPTISLHSLQNYQENRAKTWEHLALVASRPIVGANDMLQEIGKIRKAVITRQRDRDQFRIDAAKMLGRIREQRISDGGLDLFNTKLRPGGLMETEYLIGCLALRLMPDNPDLADLAYPRMVEKLAVLSGQEGLAEQLQFWRVMQLWERLLGLQDKTLAAIPARFRPLILKQLGATDYDELVDCIEGYSKATLDQLDQELKLTAEQLALLPGWQEEPVKWLE